MATTLPTALLQASRDDQQEEALTTILGRIFEERGHFRHITEQSLDAELAAEDAQESSSDAEDEDDDTGDSDELDVKDRREQVQAIREQLIALAGSAQNEVLIALDFTSLAISKEMSKQADQTMSPVLKQHVKPGVLSLDMWNNMPPDRVQQETDDITSRAWRMQSLQNCADSLLDAANRLKMTVRRETRYWDQVLSVSERGWSLCRMPREKHNLGVRFGFLEAHGAYRDRGLAALRADETGSVIFDKGIGNGSKYIRVRTQRGSETIGSSIISRTPADSDVALETRIRLARDSLYEEELFHEMTRESRTLASYGVEMHQSTISLPTRLDARKPRSSKSGFDTILIDLVSSEDEASNDGSQSSPHDQVAQAIAVTFRLLLSHTHRERLKQRSGLPQPMSLTKRDATVANVLGPILAILHHYSLSKDMNRHLNRLATLLAQASVTASVQPSRLDLTLLNNAGTAESIMEKLMAPIHSQSGLSLKVPGRSEPLDFTLHLHTSSKPAILGSRMTLQSPLDVPEMEISETEDLVESLDCLVASALAVGIADKLPGWTYNERLGVVSKAGSGRKISVEVESGIIEGDEGRIILGTGEKRIEWETGSSRNGVEPRFWALVGDIK